MARTVVWVQLWKLIQGIACNFLFKMKLQGFDKCCSNGKVSKAVIKQHDVQC